MVPSPPKNGPQPRLTGPIWTIRGWPGGVAHSKGTPSHGAMAAGGTAPPPPGGLNPKEGARALFILLFSSSFTPNEL